MRLGVAVADNWDFFQEIYAGLQASYPTRLFAYSPRTSGLFHERINRFRFERELASLLAASDVALFEWASNLLTAATRQPKRCAIVTRLHRYELYQWADRVNWDAVDRVILVSTAKQREFCDRYPAHSAKTVVINPAVNLQKFAYGHKPFAGNIGILCHLTPRKRVYDLILAFAELAHYDERLRLHIAGGPIEGFTDYYRSLHYIVGQLGLQDRVMFYGHVEDAWNWYRMIDVFVSMSYSEGLQVAPMEAMACGCYTLAHHWEGAEELVPSESLFLSDCQFQRKVLAYCEQPEAHKEEQALAMREWATEHFDIHKTINQFRQTIDCTAREWQKKDRRIG